MPTIEKSKPADWGFIARGGNAAVFDATDDEVLVEGPVGTGKTLAILWRLHTLAHNYPGFRGLLLRKTHVSLTSSTLVTFRNHVLNRQSFGAKFFGGNKQEPAAYRYPNGSVIVVGGMDNPAKVLSTDYDMVFVNEATELTEEQWETIIGRLRNYQLPFQQIIADTNPQAPTHWLNQRAEKKITRRIITTHQDNPRYWDAKAGDWTAEGYAYVVGKLQRLTGVRYQRFTLGKWVAAEGQVYESWNPQVHLLTDENPIREAALERIKWGWTIGAVDWGWAKPGVLHVYAVDGDGRMYLIAEHYMTRRSIEGWWVEKAAELQRMYDVRMWACDPSEPQNIRAFQNAGMNAVAAINDILPGISAVQERLAPTDGQIPRLYIFDEALLERDNELIEDKKPWSTVQEIPEYVWPLNTHGLIRKDRPVDENNHGMDAMRYAVAELDIRGNIGMIDDALLAAWTDLPH